MTNSPYDFQEFLQRMVKLSYAEILQEGERACASIERTLSQVKGAPKHRAQGGEVYCSQIKEFLYFMRFWTRPGSVSPTDFHAYKPVVESLITRGELKVGTLALFS